MNFITKTTVSVDLQKVIQELDDLLEIYNWPEPNFETGMPGNQIGVTYRDNANDIWQDAMGSLYDPETKTFISKESDFKNLNSNLGAYTKQVIDTLSKIENVQFGRIRFMRAEQKRGLSIHRDLEPRYHLVIKTNPGALFGEYYGTEGVAAQCYHLPADGYFYKVDTTRNHFIYNGGWEDRIHLVLCEIKE